MQRAGARRPVPRRAICSKLSNTSEHLSLAQVLVPRPRRIGVPGLHARIRAPAACRAPPPWSRPPAATKRTPSANDDADVGERALRQSRLAHASRSGDRRAAGTSSSPSRLRRRRSSTARPTKVLVRRGRPATAAIAARSSADRVAQRPQLGARGEAEFPFQALFEVAVGLARACALPGPREPCHVEAAARPRRADRRRATGPRGRPRRRRRAPRPAGPAPPCATRRAGGRARSAASPTTLRCA